MKNVKMLYRVDGVLRDCYLHFVGQTSVYTEGGIMHQITAVISDTQTGNWMYIHPENLVNPKIKS